MQIRLSEVYLVSLTEVFSYFYTTYDILYHPPDCGIWKMQYVWHNEYEYKLRISEDDEFH